MTTTQEYSDLTKVRLLAGISEKLGRLTSLTDWNQPRVTVGRVYPYEIEKGVRGFVHFFIGYELRLLPVRGARKPLYRGEDSVIYRRFENGHLSFYRPAKIEKRDEPGLRRLSRLIRDELTEHF